MKEIRFYIHTNGKIPVKIWLKELDFSVSKKILKRFSRIEEHGNFGDFKKIDDDISELRFRFGSGYRVYYHEYGDLIVLLLNAGDKKLQSKDIEKAKEYLNIWRKDNDEI